MVRSFPLAIATLLAIGCASAHADPPDAIVPRPPASTGELADPHGRARVRYALADHFERAELRHGGALHVELGSASGAQHTAGGWLSNVGPDRTLDGADAVVTTRNRARLALPGTGQPAELALRLYAFRPGVARLYLDGSEIGSAEVSPAWSTARVSLDRAQLTAGEHELLVRMDRGATVDGERVYVGLDWMRLAASGEPREPGEARPRALEAGTDRALAIPAAWSVAYPFEVPAGARLRGVLSGAGRLEVWAHTDGAGDAAADGTADRTVARRIATARAGDGPQRLDVGLDGLRGELVRLELRAVDGDLVLVAPSVVTLDGDTPRSLRRPRHVLLYLIDTLRADRLRAYDPDTRVRAPGLARFGQGASTFMNARSQENWTKPSVATLLSSLMPWEHTAFSDASVVPSTVRILPEMLHDRGYVTAGFVANGYVSDRFGFERGWDAWRNYIREGRRTRGEVLAADVLSWLDARPREQPFFLYVHAIDPHVPYRPPAELVALYDPEAYRGPVDFSRDATLLERIKTGGLRLDARDRRHLEALYDGEVSYQDAQLSAILDGLRSRGLAEETMVVITADHGEELFDHGSVGHGHSLYDELLHVPLMIRMPGGGSLDRVEGSVGLVDVVPTILDALGEPIGPELSGHSVLPLMRGDGEGAPTVSVAGFMEAWRSITVGRFKLVARSGSRYALYDLQADPREMHDLSGERPIALASLRGLLGVQLAASRSEPRQEARDPGQARRAPRPEHRASEVAIDRELEAQLRALGYIGTQRRR